MAGVIFGGNRRHSWKLKALSVFNVGIWTFNLIWDIVRLYN
ncbi:hypothetical protein [Bacillus phage vB_BanS-Thrax2]|nr:hypothetical protein [Bacillus phage vB_BanS-Thrax2]